MLDFKRKSKFRKILYTRGLIILLGIFVLFLGNAAWNAYQKYSIAKKNRDNAVMELKKLQERGEKLQEDLGLLSTEKGIESELRRRFNIVKEGEDVIVIIDNKDAEVADKNKSNGGSNIFFKKLIGIFIGD